MAGKGSGWHGESRRHSLARKGVKTVVDQDKRFDVSTFVARGESLSKKLDDLDGLFYNRVEEINKDVKELIKYRDEWVEYIYKSLSEMGYDEGDIDDMEIETWATREIVDILDDRLDLQTGMEVDNLDQWIENQTGDKIDTKDIEELIYNSIPLLDKEIKNISRFRNKLFMNIESDLMAMGFDDDDIIEMQIDTWASSRTMDHIEDRIGWQRLFERTDTLETWITDRIELKASGKKKIKSVDDMSIISEYQEKDIDKKSFEDMLEMGEIWEFKKGWFKKI